MKLIRQLLEQDKRPSPSARRSFLAVQQGMVERGWTLAKPLYLDKQTAPLSWASIFRGPDEADTLKVKLHESGSISAVSDNDDSVRGETSGDFFRELDDLYGGQDGNLSESTVLRPMQDRVTVKQLKSIVDALVKRGLGEHQIVFHENETNHYHEKLRVLLSKNDRVVFTTEDDLTNSDF